MAHDAFMTQIEPTPLVIGCCAPSAQRAMAVLDGTLLIPDCTTRFVQLGPGEMLLRPFTDSELNVAELSLSGYVSRVARGDCPYVMLPVYLARVFPQFTLYARNDRGIAEVRDLRGKRVGSGAFQRTLNVWIRGYLDEEHGVAAGDVRWLIRDTPDATDVVPPNLPNIEIVHTGATLSQMLERGELDAIIAAHPPECFTRGHPQIKRVDEDAASAAQSYFGRTGLFPILHVMGIRRELVQQRPHLAHDLYTAFSNARDIAFTALERAGTSSWQNPLHTYGTGQNDLKSLAAFLRYHYKQGLSARQLTVEELFAPLSISAVAP
jgi:4,5-dihydroxyphthalate decarboxylase